MAAKRLLAVLLTTDDPPGKPGVAHLVEHLLLDLPDQTGVPTRDRLTALAAQEQALTSSERMDLFAFVARALLPQRAAAAWHPPRVSDGHRASSNRLDSGGCLDSDSCYVQNSPLSGVLPGRARDASQVHALHCLST